MKIQTHESYTVSLNVVEYRNIVSALMSYIETAFNDGEYDDYTADILKEMLKKIPDDDLVFEYIARLAKIEKIIIKEREEC